MSDHLKFYINGQWVEPSTSDTLDVINPANEQPIGKVAMGGVDDVNKAVAAAKAAFALPKTEGGQEDGSVRITHYPGQAGSVGANHRHAAGHGLQYWEAETLIDAWEYEEGRPAVKGGQVSFWYWPQETDGVLKPQGLCSLLWLGVTRIPGTGDDERET